MSLHLSRTTNAALEAPLLDDSGAAAIELLPCLPRGAGLSGSPARCPSWEQSKTLKPHSLSTRANEWALLDHASSGHGAGVAAVHQEKAGGRSDARDRIDDKAAANDKSRLAAEIRPRQHGRRYQLMCRFGPEREPVRVRAKDRVFAHAGVERRNAVTACAAGVCAGEERAGFCRPASPYCVAREFEGQMNVIGPDSKNVKTREAGARFSAAGFVWRAGGARPAPVRSC